MTREGAKEWYYSTGEKDKHGPISFNEVRRKNVKFLFETGFFAAIHSQKVPKLNDFEQILLDLQIFSFCALK